MSTKTYAVELTSENFAQVTDYLMNNSDINVSELKITDYVVLTQNVERRYRLWSVWNPREFKDTFEFNNGFSYLYFRGIRHLY